MKPVPMMPTPMSRIALGLDQAAGLGRFECRVGKPERLTAVARRHRHRLALANRIDERIQLEAVGRFIALEKKVEQRLTDFGLGLAIAAQRRRTQVVVEEHALRAEHLEALVIAIDRLAGIVDVALASRFRLKD